jgi:PEP-CTERM motif
MRTFLKSMIAVAAITVAAASAQASTVLVFGQTGTAPTVSFTNNVGGTYSLTADAAPITITNLFNPGSGVSVSNIAATFTLNAVGNDDLEVTPVFPGVSLGRQNLDSGSISIIATEGFMFGSQMISAGAVLLGFDFTGGFIQAFLPGDSGNVLASIPGSSFSNLTSAFLEVPPFDLQALSISLTSTSFSEVPVLATRFGDFRANSAGSFTTGAVPEPGTWAMMLAGFGLVGLARRRNNRSVTVTA